jgi:carbamoyltransferase
LNILGITHPISNNSAACVLINGRLIAMAEEERFTRIKHAPRVFPTEALNYCLDEANITMEQVDHIAIGYDKPIGGLRNLLHPDLFSNIYHVKSQMIDIYQSQKKLACILSRFPRSKIHFVRHHIAHAASAFFSSGFDKANIITLDGSGDSESSILGVGDVKGIEILKTTSIASSWGQTYEMVTNVLGFKNNSEEGKTMGLASYGTAHPDLISYIDWGGEIPTINTKKRDEFFKKIAYRKPTEPLTENHKDLAASIQFALEIAVQKMVSWLHDRTGVKKYCLAGGTALNCLMNGKVASLPFVEDLFIQPAASDAGTALGSAQFIHHKITGIRPEWQMEHTYWGPQFSDTAVEIALSSCTEIQSRKSENICFDIAKLLAQGQIVGWFQGRSEVGPRALGNRSILAHPGKPEMKDLINKKIKHREMWRPFAVSVLSEKVSRYFDMKVDSPFMVLAFSVLPERREEICSSVHIDGTSRAQVVHRETNLPYWNLINEFYKLTGTPAILNTSFNDAGEPIVNDPFHAISTFLRTGMDTLAIGNYIITKG